MTLEYAGLLFGSGGLDMTDSAPILTATNLHKTYRRDAVKVPVLQGLDLEVYPGEFLSVAHETS